MSLSVYFGFLLACVVVMVVPGPAVTLIFANGLRHGRRAALLNVAGVQLGLALTLGVALLCLASLLAAMGTWFVWVRLASAACLVWLGCRMLMGSGELEQGAARRKLRGGFFAQGLAVSLSNPKTLLFFGAFFPQFLEAGAIPHCRCWSWAPPRWRSRQSPTALMRCWPRGRGRRFRVGASG